MPSIQANDLAEQSHSIKENIIVEFEPAHEETVLLKSNTPSIQEYIV
jgi:hypothetical protein